MNCRTRRVSAAAADEQTGVLAGYLDQLGIGGVGGRHGDGREGGDAHGAQEVVDDLLGGLHQGAALKDGRPHTGRLRAEAENAGLTVTENLYYGLFAPCVELF